MKNVIALFVVTIGIALAASASEKDNVREVQQKLRDSGFYFGQVDGAFSTELAAAFLW